MLEYERRREERRERSAGDPSQNAPAGGDTTLTYFQEVDELIRSIISADSEMFNQQMEQENGQ